MQAHHRHTAGRILQSLAIARGDPVGATAFAESQRHWTDHAQVLAALKAAVAGSGTSDYPAASTPASESFLAAMRNFSVPLRLAGLRLVPMRTRIYVNSDGVVAVRVDEGSAMPVLRGTWATVTLEPVKHGGIVVQTDDLIRSMSPTATAAFTDDLARATAEAENLAFVSPDVAGSVLDGAPSFTGTGSSVIEIDADLRRLVDLVPGASMPGAAFTMTKETATSLALQSRGVGGAVAYPTVTVQGGQLLGLPVLITAACALEGSPATRVIGLLSPSEIFWADEGKVTLTASTEALLEMDGAPAGNSLMATGTTLVSMYQTGSVALRAIRESAWHARAGSGAYFVAGY